MRIILLIVCYLITFPSFAIYDLASINITPGPQGTSFCFLLDSFEKQMYLALTTDDQNFFFLSPTATGEVELTPWQLDPPVFSIDKVRPHCFGPFSQETLQDVQLYAGVGENFTDLIEHQKYLKIFDGFPTLTKDKKVWTLMVYMVGSSLERQGSKTFGNASKDILEMLAGTTQGTENVNLVISTGGSSREGWKTVKRSLIRDGQLYVLEDLGEASMGEPQTLSDFVLWTIDHFPAQHYALILWDHGGGTQGLGQDTSKNVNEPMMSLTHLHQAFQTIASEKFLLELIAYDACMMASIEVAEVTSRIAQVMTGSAEIEPSHGIDYTHLLTQLNTMLPNHGVLLGQIIKEGYLRQAQEKGTLKTSQITYSVFDLTQLPTLRKTFSQFTEELRKNFEDKSFLTYEVLSQGIIRAPGYPVKETGRLLRSLDDLQHIRVDFYNLLQTVLPTFPQLKSYAEQLQTNLQQLVVAYEANDKVKIIHPEAGRISVDIGSDKSYLSVLPPTYTQFSQALDLYNQKRKNDTSKPEGNFVCPSGLVCADAHWLNLQASEVLNVDGYYGQQREEDIDIYLIKPLYRYEALKQTKEIGVNGNEACQYQLCVDETTCSSLTVIEQQGLLLAEVLYHDDPAVLTLCQDQSAQWETCSILPQKNNIWGRDEKLSVGDTLTPMLLHPRDEELIHQAMQPLVVGKTPPVLKQGCDSQKAIIMAGYSGRNHQQHFEKLCDQGDCICKKNDQDESCLATSNQFRSGVRIEVK